MTQRRGGTRHIAVAKQFGTVLSGRSAGADLRAQIEELAKQGVVVVVDFSNVELATPGFADELFGKIDASLIDARRVQFAHLDGDLQVLRDLVLIQRTRV